MMQGKCKLLKNIEKHLNLCYIKYNECHILVYFSYNNIAMAKKR